MKKTIKILVIILVILITLVLIDTFQAKVFNHSPLIKISKYYDDGNILRQDKGILVNTYVFRDNKKITTFKWSKYVVSQEEVNKMNINVYINDKEFKTTIYNNETTQAFLKLLPQEYNMQELNGNEKYIYIDNTLPTNASKPNKINKGDIMLYGNDCLVIFYKSFTTNYSYTKIGHIDNLPDLDNDNIVVKFTK